MATLTRKSTRIRWASIGALTTLVFLCGFLTMFGFYGSFANPARTHIWDVILEDGLSAQDLLSIPTPESLPVFTNTERTTVLIMGMDRRPGEEYLSRTDTIILFSIDPTTNTASMLSIPRDLYVYIPGYDNYRINTAFVLGTQEAGELGGVQLAMETIEANLGVPVDHYMMLDFQTVVDIIDEFDGVEIDVPKVIDDPTYPDMNYGYDPLYIPAGVQTMDGATALKYMRTRHADNDIARSTRQQQVISSLQANVTEKGKTGLLLKSRTLYVEVKEGLYSDLELDEMLSIFNFVSQLPEGNMTRAVMDANYVYDHITESGAYVFIMKTEEVTALIAELFG